MNRLFSTHSWLSPALFVLLMVLAPLLFGGYVLYIFTLVLIYTLSGAMCAIAGILMLSRFNSVRVGHGEALLLVTVLACFLGGVDPFGGFGRVLPVVIALIVLQVLSSGLNLLGANQHLSTAVWGLFLVGVMILRWGAGQLSSGKRKGS